MIITYYKYEWSHVLVHKNMFNLFNLFVWMSWGLASIMLVTLTHRRLSSFASLLFALGCMHFFDFFSEKNFYSSWWRMRVEWFRNVNRSLRMCVNKPKDIMTYVDDTWLWHTYTSVHVYIRALIVYMYMHKNCIYAPNQLFQKISIYSVCAMRHRMHCTFDSKP